MKYAPTLFLAVLLTAITSGQTYQKFIVEGAHWQMTDHRCDGCNIGLNYPQGDFTLWFKLEGDTMIGGTPYKKLYESLSGIIHLTQNQPVPYCQQYAVAGYVREDTLAKKVFIIGNLSGDCGMVSNTDTLFIDFSLNAGDTIKAHLANPTGTLLQGNICQDKAFAVDSTDSVGFQTWVRRTVYLSKASSTASNPYRIYEGIGPSYGLIGGSDATSGTTYYSTLVSYCVGPDSTCGAGASCGTTGVDNVSLPPSVLVYPNPSNCVVFVEADELITQIEISDIAGKLIYSQNPDKQKVEIQSAGFSKGIYFCRIVIGTGTSIRKLVIN